MSSTLIIRRVVAIILIMAVSIGIARMITSMKKPPRKNEEMSQLSLVEVMPFEPSVQPMVIYASGRIQAKNKIDVFSEVTGKLVTGSKPFKEGNVFAKGQVLMRLDDTDARLNVVSLRSTFQTNLTMLLADIKIDHPGEFEVWNKYINTMDPTSVLKELPEVKDSHLKNFLVGKGIYQLFYQIRSAEAQLRKFVLEAPFTGVLASANVTEGEVIRAGQPVGVFLQTDKYELEVGIRINEKEKIQIGNEITLKSSDKTGEWTGKVARIGQSIDATTQTVKLYIDVSGTGLYDGMYLSGRLISGLAEGVMRYPANLVGDNNEVYIVSEGTLRSQKVEVVHREDNTVLIKGLSPGTELVATVVPGVRDGLEVKVKGKTR